MTRVPLLPLFRVSLVLALAMPGTFGSAQSLSITPMLAVRTAKPGESLSFRFAVKNAADSATVNISAKLKLLHQDERGWSVPKPDTPEYRTAAKRPSLMSWARVATPQAVARKGGATLLKVDVSVPKSAKGFYCAALLVAVEPDSSVSHGVRLQFVLPLLLQVGGADKPELKSLGGFVVRSKPGDIPALSNFGLRLTNASRSSAQISGRITIQRFDGKAWKDVSDSEVPVRYVLPGAIVGVRAVIEGVPPPGSFRIRANLRLNGRTIPAIVEQVKVPRDPGSP